MSHAKKQIFEIEFGRRYREQKAELDGNLQTLLEKRFSPEDIKIIEEPFDFIEK